MILNLLFYLEFQKIFKIFLIFLVSSLPFIIIIFFFLKTNIFYNSTDIFLKNNIKTIIFFFIILLSIYIFFCIIILNFFFYNSFFLKINNLNISSKNYFIIIDISNNIKYNYYIISLNKFNIIFFLLFSILYPIIFSILSYDFNNINLNIYIYIYSIFILSYLLLLIENIILFYFIYELILILVFYSMYLTANSRGGVEAALFFAGWAVLGSILVGLGIIILVVFTNTYNFTDLQLNKLTFNEIYYIYLLFFLGFGVKLSVWPFWYWLPKAHVEVSTGMSIFLSCILIKLSLYCLLRVQHLLLSEISFNICIFFTFLCSIDIVFRFINLKDLKAIVAYGSVLHTNLLLTLIHLDSFKILKSSVFYIWGHSLATTSLFLIINSLEARYSSRNILYISGVWYTTPNLGYLLFFSLVSFLDLPISIFFWGELWLWIISLDQLFILSIQILFLVNVIFISIFFKIWWGILFGTPDISIKKINIININYELNLIIIWIIFLQILLGVQPTLLSYLCGLYL